MQAMILAAGLGTRLLPHTAIKPKPLFPILNKPLLLLTIERLRNYGFDHIIINCHHLREQIVELLEDQDDVVVVEEEIILGTGGGLRGALSHMRNEPLLVTNGDIYHTVNLYGLYQHHLTKNNVITMAMHDYARFNTVTVEGERVTSFSKKSPLKKLAFTGLQVISPGILEDIEVGVYSCIIDRYRDLLNDNIAINTLRVDDCFWTDMGTVEDYLLLHSGLLSGEIPCWQEIGAVRKPYNISPRAKLPADLNLGDWVSIGEAQIGNKCLVERSVVWDDVVVEDGSEIRDAIISSDT